MEKATERAGNGEKSSGTRSSGRGHGNRILALNTRSSYEVIGPDGEAVGPKRNTRHLRALPTVVAGSDAAATLASATEAAAVLEGASLADATWDSYTSHWAAWEDWCTRNHVPTMPASPSHVAAYLATLAIRFDSTGQMLRDAEGRLVAGRLRPVSVGKALAAINKFHEWAKLSRPGDDIHVKRVIAGIRRSFGIHADEQKAALTLPLLIRLIDVSYEPDPESLRDAVAVLLSQHPKLTPRRLAGLGWEHIETAEGAATLRDEQGRPITLIASGASATCPVRALLALRQHSDGEGPVLRHYAPFDPAKSGTRVGLWQATGRPLTRQGITKLIRRHIERAGVPIPPTGIPVLTPTQANAVLLIVHAISPTAIRDRALLLTGWVGAMRRSNLSWLEWRDMTAIEDEYDVLLRFQKNDQEGKGHTITLVRGEQPRTDSVAAYEAWQQIIAADLGGQPVELAPKQPVFVAIDRHGNLGRTDTGQYSRLHPDSITEIVQRYAQAAGLTVADFGAHSLRAGFITESAEREIPIQDIQGVSGHASTEMVMRYIRPVERRRRSPARRMGL